MTVGELIKERVKTLRNILETPLIGEAAFDKWKAGVRHSMRMELTFLCDLRLKLEGFEEISKEQKKRNSRHTIRRVTID